MNIAKVVCSASGLLKHDNIAKAFDGKYGAVYTSNATNICLQLKLIDKTGDDYQANQKYRDLIKRANIEDLKILFRNALQDFPPFLIYADFLSNGYPSIEAATMTKGVMDIGTNQKIIEKCLRLWGMDSGLIIQDGKNIVIPQAEKGLPANFVKELLKALDSEFTAKMFLINILGPDIYKCLISWNLDIGDLSKALIEYETNPKQSLDRASQFFEAFLHGLAQTINVNLIGATGVNVAIDRLTNANTILKNQKHLGNGIGGFRNIAAHGVDSQTQKNWAVTSSAALASILFVPVVIRCFYKYIKNGQQEF